MSLDTAKLHRLKDKTFDTLYSQHAAEWKKMAQNARDHVKGFLPPGEKVRAGDVVSILQTAIRINPLFEAHTKKIPQNYWVLWFTEYIVEQVFPQPQL